MRDRMSTVVDAPTTYQGSGAAHEGWIIGERKPQGAFVRWVNAAAPGLQWLGRCQRTSARSTRFYASCAPFSKPLMERAFVRSGCARSGGLFLLKRPSAAGENIRNAAGMSTIVDNLIKSAGQSLMHRARSVTLEPMPDGSMSGEKCE